MKKHLNDCNYVLQKSAKSRPFVVHVDRMCKYLHEQTDSNADNLDMPRLSDISDVQERSQRSPGRVSKADTNANTPSESTITYQSVKSRPAAKQVDSIMSTPTDRTPATAASAMTAEEMDSIADTDTTGTSVSGASQADKPPMTSATSNFRVNLANSTTNCMRAQHDDVNVDVANRPHPPKADRPQRTWRMPARLLCRVHVRQGKSEFRQSFGHQSPSCMVDVRSLWSLTSELIECQHCEMSSKESSTSADESSSSKLSASSLPKERSRRRRRTCGTVSSPKSESLLPTSAARNKVRGSMGMVVVSLWLNHPPGLPEVVGVGQYHNPSTNRKLVICVTDRRSI